MKRFQFLTGFLCGALLFGALTSVAAAASGIMATISNQAIYVDGRQVQMEAYSIHGNNFVKLRDVGEAVGFNVYWDGSAAHVESGQPYTGVKPGSQGATPAQQNPSSLTEENVRATIRALRDTYPSGTYYGSFYRSASNGPYGMAPSNCAGWATLCSDTAFGNLPWRRIESPSWDQIRSGDLVRFDTSTNGHVIVVLEKTDEYIKVTESGTNNKARWGGQYFRYWLEEQRGYRLFTRYPQ